METIKKIKNKTYPLWCNVPFCLFNRCRLHVGYISNFLIAFAFFFLLVYILVELVDEELDLTIGRFGFNSCRIYIYAGFRPSESLVENFDAWKFLSFRNVSSQNAFGNFIQCNICKYTFIYFILVRFISCTFILIIIYVLLKLRKMVSESTVQPVNQSKLK